MFYSHTIEDIVIYKVESSMMIYFLFAIFLVATE